MASDLYEMDVPFWLTHKWCHSCGVMKC